MIWSAEQHLIYGLQTVSEIETSPQFSAYKPRICFHFSPSKPSEDEPWSEDATFCLNARPHFEALREQLDVQYVGGTSGIEAYDYCVPSADWLRMRLPEVLSIADKSGMIFDGWSFEPSEPAHASYFSCGPELTVFNSNSPEGKVAIEQLLRDANEMDGN